MVSCRALIWFAHKSACSTVVLEFFFMHLGDAFSNVLPVWRLGVNTCSSTYILCWSASCKIAIGIDCNRRLARLFDFILHITSISANKCWKLALQFIRYESNCTWSHIHFHYWAKVVLFSLLLKVARPLEPVSNLITPTFFIPFLLLS